MRRCDEQASFSLWTSTVKNLNMRVQYHCSNTNKPFCRYYQNQAAYGLPLPVFAGNRNQRGHGFFSSLIRFAVPLLKKGGLSLAKHLLHTGSNIVSDIESGKNIRESAKNHFVETGKGVY